MTDLITRRYQFVSYFPEWRGFYFFRWQKDGTRSAMAYIYDWFLGIAFWEIRKWHKAKETRWIEDQERRQDDRPGATRENC